MTVDPLRVLVMTVVHHPEDARIRHRQITALLARGHQVSFAAPFSAYAVTPHQDYRPIDVPRATGRRRGAAVRAAHAVLAAERRRHDIVLVHDPELLLAIPGTRRETSVPVVWDVHEDTGVSLGMKPWLPAGARPLTRTAIRLVESTAEQRLHLILAEHGYVDRFRRHHPVVPNEPMVPEHIVEPGADRVVHLGALSAPRGAAELLDVARQLHRHGVLVELIGPADSATAPMVAAAHRAGIVQWSGFLPNDAALARLGGALAGLCLLQDAPNYRHSMPTKVLEYMAHGVPVVSTPLPPAAGLLRRHRCGHSVAFGDVAGAVRAVLQLREDPDGRAAAASRGHRAVRALHNWAASGPRFVALLESWAGGDPQSPAHPTTQAART